MDKEQNYNRILEARRTLDLFGDNCEIIEDLKWSDGNWRIVLNLKNNGTITDNFPLFTTWHIIINEKYPEGEISFYPSKNNGIKEIYPHQSPHKDISNKDYYASNICLEQYSPALKSEEDYKLKFYEYVAKALEWIKRASNKSLIKKGEHFETVAFPNVSYAEQIIFTEDRESYKKWQEIESSIGLGNIKYESRTKNQKISNFYLMDFYEGPRSYKKDKHNVLTYNWGNYVTEETSDERKAIWIKLKTMPLMEPWEAPRTWGDLIRILESNGISFDEEVVPLLNELRNNRNHFMVIGFPIPEFVGEDNVELFWQGIKLPILANHETDIEYFDGFRKNEIGYKILDKKTHFNFSTSIKWVNSENWSSKDIISRGHLPTIVNELNYLVIGVGSVGSRITEAMVRMGVNKIDIVDPDIVLIGNLTRHSLLTTDLYNYKAEKMVEKLSESNIHFTGDSYSKSLEKFIRDYPAKIENYDVIIETTGENKVLNYLDELNCNAKIFSLSIGLDAKRIYISSIESNSHSFFGYLSKIQPWLDKDWEEFPGIFPRDGVGCWHPLFPARLDHVNILCNTAINIIEKDIIDKKNHITIIEREELGTTKLIVRDEVT